MQTKDILDDKNDFFTAVKNDFAERIRTEAFNGVNYCFNTDDSCATEFMIQILRDRAERGSTLWRIAVCGIFPDDSGRAMSHFIFKGTLDETAEYFTSSKAMQDIYDEVISIDNSIKKHD